jgi:hypothetical protein
VQNFWIHVIEKGEIPRSVEVHVCAAENKNYFSHSIFTLVLQGDSQYGREKSNKSVEDGDGAFAG